MSNSIEDNYFYKSTDIALYIVALANEKRISINMTKVQKLLYITYGVFLGVYKERLLDEHPQAWPYGPVFPTTRNKLVKKDFSCISKESFCDQELLKEIENDVRLNKIVELVFSVFGTWNAGQLSEWSHDEGSPWEETKNTLGFKWGNEIPDKLILDYFNSIVEVRPKQA